MTLLRRLWTTLLDVRGAILTKHTPFDQWMAEEKLITLTAQTATTAWQNLGTNTTWEVRAKVKVTTAGSGTTYGLQFADDSSGTNPVGAGIGVTSSISTVGTYDLIGRCDVNKQYVRIVISGGAPTFDVNFHAKQVS